MSRRLRVAIVGAGNVGAVLGRLLREGGSSVSAVVSRSTASARRAASFIGCRRYGDGIGVIPAETDIVFLAVPHAAVSRVAGALASSEELPLERMAVCHASGMLGADILAPAAERGAITFSFHPLQTFPRAFSPRHILPSARGIWYGIDGPAPGLRKARLLARALGGRTILVPPAERELYHAACVVASNHLTALLAALEEMHAAVGATGGRGLEPYGPILRSTLANVLRTSPGEALSGPVARGGVETVARHIESVRRACPGLLPYFARMTQETIRLADRSGTLPRDRRVAMEALLESIPGIAHISGLTQ
ncbi:MAG TPA: DUF2520 domain-containing protein [Bacteroidota bacterium]|nr:DUF2520 domain-containing protein [Bacteroidota bacterium]